jgi:hypothetical protein
MFKAYLLLKKSRKTECGANQFLTHLAVRATLFALLKKSRKTECGANQFLTHLAVRATLFALLKKSRKTECGANQFPTHLAVRALLRFLRLWRLSGFRRPPPGRARSMEPQDCQSSDSAPA